MKLYKPITVDLYNTYPLPRMSAQQHNVGRGSIITLTANGQVISLNNETVRIFARRPDGNVSYLDCAITEDGKIQADFTDQMLAAEGNVQVELEFTTTETNITTPIFIVEVNKSNVKDGVKSSNEYKALEKYTEEAKEGGKAIYIEILVDSVTKEYGYKSDNFEKVAAAFEKGKTIILHVLDTNEYAYLQTATKDYFKFILFGKNDVNAFQIFYLYSNGIIANDFINIPVLYEWALQEHKPAYTYSDVGADQEGTARILVNEHNVSTLAHADLRKWIQQLQDRINTVANSDDVSLDQLSELVAYIKDNRELIAQVTTDKVSVSSIIDNLSTSDATRPLSAQQGVVLNARISEEVRALKSLIEALSPGESEVFIQSDWNESTETSDAFIKNKPPIKNGEGEGSLQQASNSAFGNNSISLGTDNISGCRGYYIKSIDLENKFIYLSETKVNPEMNNINNLDASFSTPAYEIGDGFCIINDNYYILLATIADITNNRITFSGDIGFTTFYEDDEIDGHTFYVPSKPTIGIVTIGNHIFTEGLNNVGAGKCSYAEGRNNISAAAYAHTEGNFNIAGFNAHAEGFKTKAMGNYSHTEGHGSTTNGYYAHAEGKNGTATGLAAHAEGYYDNTTEFGARANGAHSEGINTLASGLPSHAEGRNTQATGRCSHAEGLGTKATADYSHSEGYQTYASGIQSHTEGSHCYAQGIGAHAEGVGTKASSQYQHTQGKFNIEDKANKYAHIVGNGTSDTTRSNAHTIDWQGNAEYSGDVKANAYGEAPISLAEVSGRVDALEQGGSGGGGGIALYNSAASHNAIFRGEDLTSKYTIDQICERISSGTFEDLYIGDYFDITFTNPHSSSVETMRCILAAFDYYYNQQAPICDKHHAVIISKNCIGGRHVMNMDYTRHPTEGGYTDSEMFMITLPALVTPLQTALNNHIITHKNYLSSVVNAEGNSAAGAGMVGYAAYSQRKAVTITIPNEIQVHGTQVWSSSPYNVGLDTTILPLFAYNPMARVCGKQGVADGGEDGDGWCHWWLRDVVSSAHFAGVGATGSASYAVADGGGGLRPLFLIG